MANEGCCGPPLQPGRVEEEGDPVGLAGEGVHPHQPRSGRRRMKRERERAWS